MVGGGLIGSAVGSLFGLFGVLIVSAVGIIGGYAIEQYYIPTEVTEPAESTERGFEDLALGERSAGEPGATEQQNDVQEQLDSIKSTVEALSRSVERRESAYPIADALYMVRGVLAQSPNDPTTTSDIFNKTGLSASEALNALCVLSAGESVERIGGDGWVYYPEREDIEPETAELLLSDMSGPDGLSSTDISEAILGMDDVLDETFESGEPEVEIEEDSSEDFVF
jgi:hypothetical protein